MPTTRSPSPSRWPWLLALALALVELVVGAVALANPGEGGLGTPMVAVGLVSPILAVDAGDGSGRLFIVDQAGKVLILQNGAILPTPFLDLTSEIVQVNTAYDERGLLGIAFHPNYSQNGRFFVRYSHARAGVSTDPCFGTPRGCHEEILAEYHVSVGNPNIANPVGTILFRVDKPEFNHNSGDVVFGPYFSDSIMIAQDHAGLAEMREEWHGASAFMLHGIQKSPETSPSKLP